MFHVEQRGVIQIHAAAILVSTSASGQLTNDDSLHQNQTMGTAHTTRRICRVLRVQRFKNTALSENSGFCGFGLRDKPNRSDTGLYSHTGLFR